MSSISLYSNIELWVEVEELDKATNIGAIADIYGYGIPERVIV